MGIITDYFVAEPERALACAQRGPIEADVPKLLMKRVEPVVLGSKLWAIIAEWPIQEGQEPPFNLDRFDTVGTPLVASAEPASALFSIAHEFVLALAELPNDLVHPVAACWATAEEWGLDMEPDELDGIVLGLRNLARVARRDNRRMYVWVCL